MSQIEIKCVDQTAMFTNLPEIFSGDVNIDTVKFTFDNSWNDYETKTAVFYNNPKDVYPQILDVNDVAVIPSQVMTKECKLSIGVFGTNANGDVKTSKILTYNVGKGALNSDLESTPTTPDFWTQLLSRQINFENNINSTVDTFQTTVNSKVDGLETNVETVEAIAKGRNQALAYNNYSEMITALNGMTKDELKRGQNIYIGTVGVPDLWVYGVETNKVTYTYTNDETFVSGLNTNTTVKVGYYKLAQLETQKVDVGGINSSISNLQSDVGSLETELNNTNTRVTTLENKPTYVYTMSKGTFDTSKSISTLPFQFAYGHALKYRGEIHILGGHYNPTYHYKWNGSSWTSVSTLPYELQNGNAIVYNDEIHIFGSAFSDQNTKHYKWNGSSWVSVSTLPIGVFYDCSVILNNEIHLIYDTSYYKFNGNTWSKVGTLSKSLREYKFVVWNNEIYAFTKGNAYKINGTTLTQLSTELRVSNIDDATSVVVLNNKVHFLGSSINNSTSVYYRVHYVWDGESVNKLSNLPYDFYNGSAIINKGFIILLGSNNNATLSKYHYELKSGDYISGYVKANTNMYIPQQSEPCTDNLEKITDGYRVTEDGYVEILI